MNILIKGSFIKYLTTSYNTYNYYKFNQYVKTMWPKYKYNNASQLYTNLKKQYTEWFKIMFLNMKG